ncbi:MAG: M20/M25/M40 family metallo-hydrolase [Lachnospiraceae bacterium]|nr:M20/M25/M40 family metallo-hydrolase [Lachnospiraceae bacterium]
MDILINEDRMLREFAELVAIDSPSFGERQMADRLTGKLKALGFTVREDGAEALLKDVRELAGLDNGQGDGILNAFRMGTLPGSPILFSAHMDTVEPSRGKQAVFREDGRITSAGDTVLGSDDAAGLAEILEAVRCVQERGLPCRDIEIVFSVAEEAHCKGTAVFDFGLLKAKEAYILDLSGAVGAAAVQAPSIVTFEATVTGKAAHAGFAPEEGIHAIAIMSQAITRIAQGRFLAGTDEETTVNIGSIRGGGTTNIVPASCVCNGEIRSCSHAHAMEMADRVRSIFEKTCAEAGAGCEVKVQVNLTAYKTETTSPAVRHFQKACETLSLPGTLVRTFGGSDNNHFVLHGISGIVLSCGMQDVHSVREHIDMKDLIMGAQVAAELMTGEDGC